MILSTFPIKEVAKGRFERNHGFVTVKFLGVFVTSLHLNSKKEARRLHEIGVIRQKLIVAKVWREAQIWAGDFNSVTKKDDSKTKWAQIEVETKKLHSDNPKHDKEPKTDVVERMVELDFTDC